MALKFLPPTIGLVTLWTFFHPRSKDFMISTTQSWWLNGLSHPPLVYWRYEPSYPLLNQRLCGPSYPPLMTVRTLTPDLICMNGIRIPKEFPYTRYVWKRRGYQRKSNLEDGEVRLIRRGEGVTVDIVRGSLHEPTLVSYPVDGGERRPVLLQDHAAGGRTNLFEVMRVTSCALVMSCCLYCRLIKLGDSGNILRGR